MIVSFYAAVHGSGCSDYSLEVLQQSKRMTTMICWFLVFIRNSFYRMRFLWLYMTALCIYIPRVYQLFLHYLSFPISDHTQPLKYTFPFCVRMYLSVLTCESAVSTDFQKFYKFTPLLYNWYFCFSVCNEGTCSVSVKSTRCHIVTSVQCMKFG